MATTRRDYLNGLQQVEMKPGMVSISLVGDFPNYLEHGGPARDMREFLLGPEVPVTSPGQKGKRMSAEGYAYRSIPFRHTPPSSSSKTGQAMGSQYSGHSLVSDSHAMGKDIYAQAKALSATTTNPYSGKTTWGERLSAPNVPKLKGHHKVNIYEGMVRQEKTYRKATQSQYTTFRTISEHPASEGWIRPPRAGVDLASKMQLYGNKLASSAFEEYVKGLSGK